MNCLLPPVYDVTPYVEAILVVMLSSLMLEMIQLQGFSGHSMARERFSWLKISVSGTLEN
ncbi:hypothetical protein OROHE_002305 [Orobanche hederae]